MNVFQRELDVSDPYTFLFLKRGILRMFHTPAQRYDLNSPENMCSSSHYWQLPPLH